MLLNKKSVELLAPAGNWETLVAAIDAGLMLFIWVENILICVCSNQTLILIMKC